MAYQVEIEPTGDIIEVEEGQTILDAALRQGVYLPHACSHGLCGTCKVELLEGEIDHGEASSFALMDMEKTEGKCLVCTSTAQSDLVIEADIDEDPDARSISVEDFQGTVIEVKDLTPRIKGIVMELDRPIDFQAGQYVQFHVPQFGEPRAFSIASSPKEGNIMELNISLVPDGKATPWIHENVKVGDQFKISGPFGRFFVRESAQLPMLFFAGGSGLSSPKSMIEDLLERGCNEQITLFHGARNEAELYYADRFRAYEEKHPNFKYVPVLSDEENLEWKGETGYLDSASLKVFDNNFSGHKAYLCGPPPMIEACINGLFKGRLFEKDIYVEKFYSKADLSNQQQKSPFFKSI